MAHAKSSPLSGYTASPWFNILAGTIVVAGIIYAGYHLASDLSVVRSTQAYPFVLLGIALFIALGFEFVNGFHDTANAVATVIYTHSLPPNFAVIWSGAFNFLGVLVSSGAVAFGIVSLLPVELILQVGSGAGFAMVFALLIAAILWNLGTWYFGLPSSSSHTLIGSIMGVGLMNQLMSTSSGTSGVDWAQATKIGESLLFSPIVGFSFAAMLLLAAKALIPIPALYKEPQGNKPPPLWIRGLLVLTCTGVSFAHGSNDGQKGMGLIMLILIGTVPTAYALNRAMHEQDIDRFVAVSTRAEAALGRYAKGPAPADPHAAAIDIVRSRSITAEQLPALEALAATIKSQVTSAKSMDKVPAGEMVNIRNEMYLVSEGLRFLGKSKTIAMSSCRQGDGRRVQDAARQLDQVHSELGEGGGGDRARPRHHDRLEAHRGHGGRAHRQDASDLRAGRIGRAHRNAHDRRGGHVRPAGEHHACTLLGRRRNHGRQSVGPAVGDGTQSAHGVGAYPAGLDCPGGRPVLAAEDAPLDAASAGAVNCSPIGRFE